ncbi:MAG: YdcF family protein [Ruminococcus sp.]|nr:YdcF family protein [Ruminococcus sp.]
MTIINIFFAMEVILLSCFLVSLPRICIGNIAGIFITALLFLITGYHNKIGNFIYELRQSFPGKISVITLSSLLMCIVIYLSVLTILMIKAQRNYPKSPCTAIVLGCRVKNGLPTRMLRRRLDSAFEYLEKNPDSFCILSGGKGEDEIISEAEAMYRYLLNKGITSDKLIKEDKSTSTKENLEFSMDIINKIGIASQVVIVTDGFHQFRANLIAKEQDIKAFAVSAHTEPRYIFIYWVREWIAITVLLIKKLLKDS